MPTKLSRKLTKQSPAKERRQAKAIFANAHGSPKAMHLAGMLQKSATRKLKKR